MAKKIAHAIEASAKPSEPWCTGLLPHCDAAIEVRGFGPLTLPVRPAGVRKLADVASPAPYGKGTETVIDTSVRDTLEVDAANVNLLPEFIASVQAARQDIAQQLQLDEERLQIELYKLLIYPKGGFFLPHRDSEKRTGMVATMVVVMPAAFRGGELLIHHDGHRQRFSFPEARAQKQPQYVAFFADCEHEVKKVTSGVRVCLAFNLSLKPERKSKPPKPAAPVDPMLWRQVADWFRRRPSDPLVFALNHQYTEAGLTPSRLKGTDKDLHKHVAAVAQALDCRLHFGQVERHLCQFADDGSFGYGRRGYARWSGDFDDLEIGEAFDDEIVVDGWKNAQGKPEEMAPLACEASQLISLVPAEDWIPTRQDYEGYTGNAGNTLQRWYHKSVIAIWPTSQHFEILTQMGSRFAVAQLLDMRGKLRDCEDDELEQACDDCQQLAEAIIDRWPDRKLQGSVTGRELQPWLKQFACELPKFDDPDLFARFLRVISERDWQTDLDQCVSIALRRMGVEDVLPALQSLLRFTPPPNQYGVRFLEGLATRDASWLLKLAKHKNNAGLSPEQLRGLLSIATEKLSADTRSMTQDSYRRSPPPTNSWLVLCQAMIAASDERLDELLQLTRDYPAVYDFRKFQVPSAVTLRAFSMKRQGELPAALRDWIEELIDRLIEATAEKPRPPADYRRKSETGCNCKYCQQLSRFLSDPALEQTRIPAPARDRDHLEWVIRTRNLDVAMDLIRSGRPYALELTKTTAAHQADVQRFQKDLKLLSSLQ